MVRGSKLHMLHWIYFDCRGCFLLIEQLTEFDVPRSLLPLSKNKQHTVLIAACWICVVGRCRHVLDIPERLTWLPIIPFVENTEVGTEMINVPQNLTLSPYTHWAVYTKSSLVEQSTPASLLIYAAWKMWSLVESKGCATDTQMIDKMLMIYDACKIMQVPSLVHHLKLPLRLIDLFHSGRIYDGVCAGHWPTCRKWPCLSDVMAWNVLQLWPPFRYRQMSKKFLVSAVYWCSSRLQNPNETDSVVHQSMIW